MNVKEFNNWNFTLLSYQSELSVARLQRLYELGFPTAEKLINKLEEYLFISPKNENDKRVVLDKLRYLFIIDKYVNGNLTETQIMIYSLKKFWWLYVMLAGSYFGFRIGE